MPCIYVLHQCLVYMPCILKVATAVAAAVATATRLKEQEKENALKVPASKPPIYVPHLHIANMPHIYVLQLYLVSVPWTLKILATVAALEAATKAFEQAKDTVAMRAEKSAEGATDTGMSNSVYVLLL